MCSPELNSEVILCTPLPRLINQVPIRPPLEFSSYPCRKYDEDSEDGRQLVEIHRCRKMKTQRGGLTSSRRAILTRRLARIRNRNSTHFPTFNSRDENS